MKKKLITLTFAIATIALINPSFAQREKNQLVVTAGAGYSIGMAFLKGVLNTGLATAGLSDVKATPVINGMVDFGITDVFSLGAAYSYNNFGWTDSYTSLDTATSTPIVNYGDVSLARHNVAGRALFHFGQSDKTDMYAGARLGTSIWKAKYAYVSTSGETAGSEFDMPTGLLSVQALFGFRTYFNDFLGVNLEVGIGTSPYFVAGGLVFKI